MLCLNVLFFSHSNELKSLEGDKKSLQTSLEKFDQELNQQLQKINEYKHKVLYR